jgi:hypothetical protein
MFFSVWPTEDLNATPQAMRDAIGAYGKSFNFVLITLSQPLQQWLPLV